MGIGIRNSVLMVTIAFNRYRLLNYPVKMLNLIQLPKTNWSPCIFGNKCVVWANKCVTDLSETSLNTKIPPCGGILFFHDLKVTRSKNSLCVVTGCLVFFHPGPEAVKLPGLRITHFQGISNYLNSLLIMVEDTLGYCRTLLHSTRHSARLLELDVTSDAALLRSYQGSIFECK